MMMGISVISKNKNSGGKVFIKKFAIVILLLILTVTFIACVSADNLSLTMSVIENVM